MTEATQSRTSSFGSGTSLMLIGTAVSIVTVYLFQVLSGRTLGAEGFAPVGMLWTISFLVFTIVMIPVEQFITRRLVLARGYAGSLRAGSSTVLLVVVGSIVLGMAFVVATLDRFFEGDPRFIVVALVLFVSRSVLAASRGFLAGRRRFAAYGGALGLEGLALMTLGGIAALVAPTALGFSTAMSLAPLAVLVFQPFRSVSRSGADMGRPDHAGTFLGAYVLASGSAQIILAGGPIVVGFIGGTAAQVSVYFITFTLFRGPITSSYNLVARVLPDFTDLAARGDDRTLSMWAKRFGLTGALLAIVGFVTAGLLGPWIIDVLYGSEFSPPTLAAALGGAAVGAGLAAVFAGQVLVAGGRTSALAVGWSVALVAAAIAVAAVPADAVTRAAAGFAAGEITALILLSVLGRAAAFRT